MNERDLDRALSGEEIVPSSGFTGSVMEAIRADAYAPKPIPFPWHLVATFGLACAAVPLCAVWLGGGQTASQASHPWLTVSRAVWVAMAVAVAVLPRSAFAAIPGTLLAFTSWVGERLAPSR